jgi:NhaP-type Na+/H+ or K+/H+ antiporter
MLVTISSVSCDNGEREISSQIALCFLFFALLVGALLTYLLSRSGTELPYTVAVFAFGVIVAAGFRFVSEKDTLKQSIVMWDNFEPHLILFIFLPALLFGESMSLNFHHVRSAVWSSLLLAGPGAVFGTFAIGVVAKYVLPYNWSWSLCFVFGSILCATDPVAVVALLKKAGASSRLTYLIIGEALLNDGTALVLYNLLFTLLKVHNTHNKDIEPLNVFLYFLKVIFISPLLGLAFGVGSLVFLSLANRRMHEEDTTVQMAVTICCAYLSFFVGEEILGVSGVITC